MYLNPDMTFSIKFRLYSFGQHEHYVDIIVDTVSSYFVHWLNVIPNGWLDVDPTSLEQQTMHTQIKYKPFLFKQCVGPLFVQHDLGIIVIYV